MRFQLGMPIVICLVGVLAAHGTLAVAEDAQLHDLLTNAPLPEGFTAEKRELVMDGVRRGDLVLITHPERAGRMVVMIDEADRPTSEHRRAACKAYVNAAMRHFGEAGFRPFDVQLPDVDKFAFDEPLSLDIKLRNGQGEKVYLHFEVLFSDTHGVSVQVVAIDPAELDNLTPWAKSVKLKAQ